MVLSQIEEIVEYQRDIYSSNAMAGTCQPNSPENKV